jgi:hypothetical protein
MDITRVTERFYEVLGQAWSWKEKGDHHLCLTKEKHAEYLSAVKAAKVLFNRQSIHYRRL